MNNPIYATWCLSNNIGDALTPWLIEKITGQMPLYVPYGVEYPKFMVSGSILNHAVPYTIVWGAGIADSNDIIHTRNIWGKNIDIRATRGPYSARRARIQAGIPVDHVGDPAWLMPKFYIPVSRSLYKVGIIPHYVHHVEAAQWIGERTDIKLINVFDTPENFVDDLLSCDVVYSSSLHGLIIADAYGIPSQWMDGTAKLGGDGIKFHDHLVIKEFLIKFGCDAVEKLRLYVREEIEDKELEGIKRPVRVHIQQLPRDIEVLHSDVANKPMPKPEAVAAFCETLWSACPFRPEEVEQKENNNETINSNPNNPGPDQETPATDRCATSSASS